jgi:DNA-directed RNA polymerase specialized sigma24 family protein
LGEDGTPQDADFPVTRWTLVDRAAGGGLTVSSEAMNELLNQYWPAMKTHLVSARRIPPDEAEDLVQGFVVSKVLERDLIACADRERGRFRSLLVTALDRYVVSQRRASSARCRSSGRPMSDPEMMDRHPAPECEAATAFDVAWARQLLQQVISAVEAECRSSGRADVWGVLEGRVLGPVLDGQPPADYEELVRRFGFQSPTQAANVLVTAKRLFQRTLRGAVQAYAGTQAAVEEEIEDLWRILTGRRAGSA